MLRLAMVLLTAAMAICGALAADRAAATQDATKVVCQECSHVDSAGVVHIDSSAAGREFGWRRYALTADDFVPGGRYRVTFRARVEGHGKSAHLYVLVRPRGWGGDEKDVASLSVKPTDGSYSRAESSLSLHSSFT